MMFDWIKDVIPIVEKSAPVIANALNSPAATFAISLLANAFGLKDENISKLPEMIKDDDECHNVLCSLERNFGALFNASNIQHFIPKKLEVTLKLDWTG